MITIGQLADYAGVTIKAVRHYHKVGLLEEPPRDSSGYRRYSAQHAIDLVKIKTLVDAGVPLARIRELLAADADQFAAAVSDIDRMLQERTRELRHTRERIARLRSGDRLFVSAGVADYLDQLQQTGVSQRCVRMERDLWILMESVAPHEAAAWLADKLDAIADPEFRSIYVEYDAAFDWSPTDRRLDALAVRTERWFASRANKGKPGGEGRSAPDPSITQLLETSGGASSPAWARLAEIARERKTHLQGAAKESSPEAAPGDARALSPYWVEPRGRPSAHLPAARGQHDRTQGQLSTAG